MPGDAALAWVMHLARTRRGRRHRSSAAYARAALAASM
ncbi:hypothetical protein BURMUCGD2M_1469 [Burkholderia multivorans CGD2M]|uniref:Uncharacterized protein n=1 Tax=Burkholderia multivorans CGD2 TaxID=513052 RepID=B9BPZ5_9BURK|nr:hypothetical protein BURMUCGD2_1376 [Burkholderia multivorans CGD2]EEE13368.1 hypothetical protein BURMUCGD2M_1469 [Burkholderia multivorans CGD2M]